jgi:DNA ligase-associated metallophosphoesterase
MPTTVDLTLTAADGPVAVRLHAAGALEVPQARLLLIADPHFGKAATFQHAGVPIPDRLHDQDLARLSQLLTATAAAHLVILGDFFHSRHSQNPTMLDTLWRWRNAHSTLAVTVILGNHDRHAGPLPTALDMTFTEGPCLCGPFTCLHEPPSSPSADQHVLAGHLHPVIALHDRAGAGLRLPCFWVGTHVTVLPAFGTFTGGHAIRPLRGERIFAAAQGEIREVTRLVAPRSAPHTP